MKATLYTSKGEKKSEIELPEVFSSAVREDIAQKYFEVAKERQPYAPYEEAGRRHSASGRIRHIRHKWRSAYGRGISRAPRKTMWRRGTQFYWVGAEVSGARGGRRAIPPRLNRRIKKINKNEIQIALSSAFAATADKNLILKRYSSLKEIQHIPAVIESLPGKTKELLSSLENIFKNAQEIIAKNKVVRAGKGKSRGRKYKSNAGILIITGNSENAKFKGLDIKQLNEIKISDLYPLGRLALYTKKAIDEMSNQNKQESKGNKQ